MLRVAAGFLLEHGRGPDRRWLLLHSVKWREWGFPKGHCEPGESPLRTALRECGEGCGIALIATTGRAYRADYTLGDGRRKRVHYFPARTAQTTIDLSSEHDRGEWLPAAAVLDRLPHTQLRTLFTAHHTGQPWL